MEAMPRLPMISFQLKQVHKSTTFSDFIKRCIVTQYGDNPNSFAQEMYELDNLRLAATRPGHDLQGLATLKRYFCQLQALACRFPQLGERHVEDLVFTWQDLYSISSAAFHDPSYEMASIMYNIGALHTMLGAADPRQTPDGMKISCTHFQCAAWAFQFVQEKLSQPIGTDLNRGMMQFNIEIALAQAQECILEKSMVDNRKGIITAKVAAQVADYHRAARRCLENALKTGEYLSENIGDRKMKQWVEHVELKAPLYDAISLLYRGMQSEEQQRMGERITFYQAAMERLQEAATVAKRMSGTEGKLVSECLTFNMDVIGGKLNNAKKENEFIYHEKVPQIESLPEIKGASLVKGIPFDLTDKDVSGPDIFQKLIPMEAHEHASLYSSKKDELLRALMVQVDEKDQELLVFLSSLQLDQLEMVAPFMAGSSSSIQLPQELVDCVASLHARTGAVGQLTEAMSRLSGLSVDLQDNLDELETLLKEEDDKAKEHAAALGGRRPPSMITAELRREFTKYRDAHQHAAESDSALHRAISAHLPNLTLLSGPLDALEAQLPSVLPVVQQPEATANIAELQRIVDKVEQMRRQRSMLCNHLRDAVHSDDITRKVVTRAGDDIDAFIDRELDKHRKQAAVIEQNLAAQDNILRALTEANAAYAPTRQLISDLLAQREARVTDLLTSYRALDELLEKGSQGVQFYTKLQESVGKLLTRARSVCKVQDEERSSVLTPTSAGGGTGPGPGTTPGSGGGGGGPRLRDYLAAGYRAGEQPPRHRPSPLGSEQSEPGCRGGAAAPSAPGYAAQMAQYMAGPAAASAPRAAGPAAPEAAGYAAQMAQYMAGPSAASAPRAAATAGPAAPDAAGYAAQMAQYMNPGHQAPAAGPTAGGYAPQARGSPARARAGSGYPAAQGRSGAGYPPVAQGQSGSGYPPATQGQGVSGYPPTQGQDGTGYPQAQGQSAASYQASQSQTGAGFPPSQGQGQGSSGYPPSQGQGSTSYPPSQGQGQASAGYPPPQGQGQNSTSYPPSQNPAQNSAVYPPSQSQGSSGYPPSQGQGQHSAGYPASQGQSSTSYPPSQNQSSAPPPSQNGAAYPAPAPSPASSASPQSRAGYGPPAGPFSPPGHAAAAAAASSAGNLGYTSDPYLAFYGGGSYTSWTPYQTFSRPPGDSRMQAGAACGQRPIASHALTTATHSHGVSSAVGSGPGTAESAAAVPGPLYTPPRLVGTGGAQTAIRPSGIAPYALATGYPGPGAPQAHPGPGQAAAAGQNAYSAVQAGPGGAYAAASQQSAYGGYPPAQNAHGGVSTAQNAYGSGQQPQSGYGGAQQSQGHYGGTAPAQGSYGGPQPAHTGYGAAHPASGSYGAAQRVAGHSAAAAQSAPGSSATTQTTASAGSTAQSAQGAYGAAQRQPGGTGHYSPSHGPYGGYGAGQQPAHAPQGATSVSPSTAAGGHQGQQASGAAGYQQYPGYGYQQQQQQPQSHPATGQWQYPTAGQQQQHGPNAGQHSQQQQYPASGQASGQQQYPASAQQGYPTAGQTTGQHQYPTSAQAPGQQQYQAPGQYPAAGQATGQQQRPAAGQAASQQYPVGGQQQYGAAAAAAAHGSVSAPALNTAQYSLPTPAGQADQQRTAQQQNSQTGQQQQQRQSSVQPAQQQSQQPQQHQQQQPAAPAKTDLLSQNAQLLAGLDLSAPALAPTPTPAPAPAALPPVQPASAPAAATQVPAGGVAVSSPAPSPAPASAPVAAASPSLDLLSAVGGTEPPPPGPAALQPRVVTSEAERQRRQQADRERRKLSAGGDPYTDAEKLHTFVQDVERLDKFVASLTKKSLNGPTPLDSKWKELTDQQEADGRQLKISVARCYPMKNRFQDVLPFDSSLVPVPLVRDDYINASRLPELSPGSPALIATQAPLSVTQTDFWCMVWHHQVELVVCLLPDSELEGQVYWPTERCTPVQHGPLQLTLQSQSPANGRVERIISVLHSETKMSRVVIHLQFSGWPRAAMPASPAPLVHFVAEVLHYHQQQRSLLRPLVVHCSGGVGRSGVFCLVAAVLAEVNAGCGLVDLPPIARLLNTARRNCLQDKHHLLFAYQAVLYAAQDFLMKRGILTSRASFDQPPGQSHSGHSRHPSEDFLATNRSVCELQARLGALTASPGQDPAPASPSHGTAAAGSTASLPAGPPPPPPSAAASAAAPADTSRPSSAPALSGALAACLDPATFQLDPQPEPAAPAPAPAAAAAENDPLSELDPLWSLKKQ